MSLYAWSMYASSYSWTALKTPVSLTLWQHAYNLNALLVVQEMADTFGLLCLMMLFLASQLFARNYMFSIFLLSPRASSSVSPSLNANSRNAVKPLTTTNSALTHLVSLLRSNFSLLSNQLRGK